jgi:hypothetical protein
MCPTRSTHVWMSPTGRQAGTFIRSADELNCYCSAQFQRYGHLYTKHAAVLVLLSGEQ